MPDRRKHRGPDPRDARDFSPGVIGDLRSAGVELSWLLTRGYAPTASLKLVGDRYRLTARQRAALARCACSDQALERRRSTELPTEALAGRRLALDGFNVLTTVESALGGAVVLVGRDGCCRDIAGVHGSFRSVEETVPALRVIGEYLELCGSGPCAWYFDSPVSNSGRIAQLVREEAMRNGWRFSTNVVTDPDRVLRSTSDCVATADAGILDHAASWVNLVRAAIRSAAPQAWVVYVFGEDESSELT